MNAEHPDAHVIPGPRCARAVIAFCLASLGLAGCSSAPSAPAAPAGATAPIAKTAAERSATTDPYLWLEAIDDDKALDWARAQNDRSLGTLTGDPRFEGMYGEALAILNSEARIPYGQIHGDYVYNFWQDDEHVRGLWRRAPLDSYTRGAPEWETLLDVDALDEHENENWIFQGYDCLSPEFENCLVVLSRGGTDAAVLREYSVSQRDFVADGFVVPQAKSSAEWVDADTLLVGTDWGDGLTESGYARTIKRWRRGTEMASASTVYTGESTDVGVFAQVSRNEETVYPFTVRAITFFQYEYLWHRPDGSMTKLPIPGRATVEGILDGRAIVSLREKWSYAGRDYAQGALVALTLGDMSAELVYAPSGTEAIDDVEVGESAVFVELLDNVIGKVRRLTPTRSGWSVSDIPLPENGVVQISSVNDDGDDLLVSYESLTIPDSLLYVAVDNSVSDVMALPEMYDANDVIVEQRFATSKDGTQVPYFIMARKDVLARGNAPTVQYGYGGFQVAVVPTYYTESARPQHGALAGKLWISRGGVLVLSNIRGGGEYGPAWHEAALKTNRHKAFEDFFAIAEDLIRAGVTTPQKLGAIGRSNGGLLMGAALTQRPDLYAAIDCGVPLLDMLRYHTMLAGASWVGEYGSAENPDEYEYLADYSPYQKLRKEADYPPVFIYTSTKDDRVHPGHARKMAAKMADYGHEFLYYENIEGGHGGTANQEQLARRTALEWMFFLRELGE